MKIKQRPEDFVVREGYRFEEDPTGPVFVYRLDKQKVSTLQALERIGKEFAVRRRALSICGLKDKQGRTEQLIGVEGGALGTSEQPLKMKRKSWLSRVLGGKDDG